MNGARASLFSRPRGPRHELRVYSGDEPPLTASAPEHPGRACAPGLRRRARLQQRPAAQRGAARRDARLQAGEDERVGGARRRARQLLRLRPGTARDHAGPGRRHVHHVAFATEPEDQENWQKRMAEAGTHADAGDRSLLLQVGLLPRAERRAVRARDDGTGLHGRRGRRASRRAALAAAALRAPARAARRRPHAAAVSARQGAHRTRRRQRGRARLSIRPVAGVWRPQ